MRVCPKCNEYVPDGVRHCTRCGTSIAEKKCPKCGKTLPSDADFCPECGTRATADSSQRCSRCNCTFPVGAQFCPSCGTPRSATNNSTNHTYGSYSSYGSYGSYNQSAQPNLPMNWYNALIYAFLFLGAISNFVTGIQCFTGSMYGDAAELVYEVFEGLEFLNIIAGIDCMLMAVFGLVVRSALANYQYGAPGKLITLYSWALAHNLLYYIIIISTLSDYSRYIEEEYTTMVMTMIFTAIGNIICICCNKVYFDKRQDMFDC